MQRGAQVVSMRARGKGAVLEQPRGLDRQLRPRHTAIVARLRREYIDDALLLPLGIVLRTAPARVLQRDQPGGELRREFWRGRLCRRRGLVLDGGVRCRERQGRAFSRKAFEQRCGDMFARFADGTAAIAADLQGSPGRSGHLNVLRIGAMFVALHLR